MKIVMLDGDTLPQPPTRPEWCTAWDFLATTAHHEIVAALRGAQIAITNKVPLREEALKQLPDLRYICVAATGYDCIDLDACRERGIVVSNVPGYSTRSVSEGVIAALFALRRHLVDYANSTRAAWPASSHFCVHRQPIQDIFGATLGIVGLCSVRRGAGTQRCVDLALSVDAANSAVDQFAGAGANEAVCVADQHCTRRVD